MFEASYGEQFYELYGVFNKKADKTPENVERIDKALRGKLETIFARENEDGFVVLVPTQMLVSMKVIKS